MSLDRQEMVRDMIDAGADVNLCDKCGNSPLHEAVERGNLRMVRILLDSGKTRDIFMPSGIEFGNI